MNTYKHIALEATEKFGSAILTIIITFHTPVAVAQEPIDLGYESAIYETSIITAAPRSAPGQTVTVTLTGYSSTEDQTDDSPFITASNKQVADGIVAANFLPFGTRLQIPKLFGDKVFTVEDRMHKRFSDRVDIWFADRNTALNFGRRTAEIVIL
ncbi:MAG: 3D domain-containing protein [bacterium]|nr:3D domain-containing protein [bacterium]